MIVVVSNAHISRRPLPYWSWRSAATDGPKTCEDGQRKGSRRPIAVGSVSQRAIHNSKVRCDSNIALGMVIETTGTRNKDQGKSERKKGSDICKCSNTSMK